MNFTSVSTKINIAIVGVFLVSLFIGVSVLFWYVKKMESEVYQTTRNDLIISVDEKIKSKMQVGITNAISIANDNRITDSFKKNDRESAIKSFTEISIKMKKYTDFKNIKIHLHTKDNKSFVRNWKPEKFGDDLSSFRKAVVSVNKTRNSISTFEPGRAGLLLRAITPVVDSNGQHLGSLEFIQGINSVVKSFDKKSIGFLLLMDKNINRNIRAEKNFSFKKDVDFKDYIISQRFINKEFLRDATTVDMQKLFKDSYFLSSNYFYTFKDVKNFENKKLGIILIAKPLRIVNSVIDKSKNLIYLSLLGVTIMMLIISSVIILAVKRLVISPLKIFEIGLFDFFLFLQGKQDFTKHIDINSNDEFSKMANSLNENIAVSARLHEELRSLYSDLEEKVEIRTQELAEINKEVQDSIEYASTIQKSFLKHSSLIEENFSDSFAIWEPRDKVGGDLYVYEESSEGIIFGVVDCTGHSVPGGFMTMLAGSMIKKLATEHFTNPAKLLSELNIAIKKQLNQDGGKSLSDDGLDMGLCFINKAGTILKFSGAKVDLLYFKDNEQHIIKSNKQSIGYKRSKSDYEYTNHELQVDSSESFYMYSDGITDQTGGAKNFPLGNKKFKTFLSDIQENSMSEQKNLILDNLIKYQSNNSRRDDITVIGFKIKKEQ